MMKPCSHVFKSVTLKTLQPVFFSVSPPLLFAGPIFLQHFFLSTYKYPPSLKWLWRFEKIPQGSRDSKLLKEQGDWLSFGLIIHEYLVFFSIYLSYNLIIFLKTWEECVWILSSIMSHLNTLQLGSNVPQILHFSQDIRKNIFSWREGRANNFLYRTFSTKNVVIFTFCAHLLLKRCWNVPKLKLKMAMKNSASRVPKIITLLRFVCLVPIHSTKAFVKI